MKPFTIEDIKQIINSSVNVGPTGHPFIDSRYQDHIDIYGETTPYYRLFFHLAQQLEPQLTVELGGYQGTAAAHFAQGYSDGRVLTIDHHTDPGDDLNIDKMIEATTHYPNLVYRQGWTRQDLAGSQKGKHALGDAKNAYPYIENYVERNETGIDILFIDSWHNYEEATADWKAYEPLLSEASLVICDDISDLEMLKFYNELPGKKFLENRMHVGVPMGFMRYERK